jgi:hypothetical protein
MSVASSLQGINTAVLHRKLLQRISQSASDSPVLLLESPYMNSKKTSVVCSWDALGFETMSSGSGIFQWRWRPFVCAIADRQGGPDKDKLLQLFPFARAGRHAALHAHVRGESECGHVPPHPGAGERVRHLGLAHVSSLPQSDDRASLPEIPT